MKTTLFLKQNFPFAQNPRNAELENDKILCNNIIFEGEFNPHNVRLFVIGHEFGAIGAVWASCEQDALDELVDCDLGDCFLIDLEEFEKMSEEEKEQTTYLGNASEPADLSYVWIGEVEFDKVRDFEVLMKFAEARGSCCDNLDKL